MENLEDILPPEETPGTATPARSRKRRSMLGKAADRFRARPMWQRIPIGVVAGTVLLVALLVGADLAVALGRIHPRVSIADIEVGGLSREAAAQKAAEELSARLTQPVTLQYEDRTWEVEATSVGAFLDPDGYAEEAFLVGRRGSLWRRVTERARLWVKPRSIPAYVQGETTLTASFFDEVAEVVEVKPEDATVAIEGVTPVLIPSSVGVAIEREAAESELLGAFVAQDREVSLPVRVIAVQVADDDAKKALEDARTMLSAPVVLEYESTSWKVAPAEIARWIGFEAIPFEEAASNATTASAATEAAANETTAAVLPGRKVLEVRLRTEDVSATVTPFAEDVGRPAADARFKTSAGSVSVIPSEVGLGLDVDALSNALVPVLLETAEETRRTTLTMKVIEPELTTAEAEGMGIKERISTFTTTYSSSNRPRVNNIHTLADALDGVLVAPGAAFSFNDAVGPRTADKGYQEAGTIVNGELVPTLGGGICQVCTTLFNSVFFSGLPVDQRRNHSFYISSYPAGRDATVSWGGPDFKFTNDTENWILIATGYTSSSVTISLYGTDPGYDVEYTTGPFTDIRPFPVKEVKDPTLDIGVRAVEDPGIDGRTVVVTRRVTKSGQLVRKDTFTSKYNPKQETVRVGTKQVAGSGETTGTGG